MLFHIYSGDIFFSAAIILTLAVIAGFLLPAGRYDLARRVIRTLFLLSVPLGALGTVPVPPGLAFALVGAWIAHAALGFGSHARRGAVLSGSILLLLAAASIAPEIAWRLRQPPELAPPPTIFVFGDSISSGGFGESRTWVDHLDGSGGTTFINLSMPSDTMDSVLRSRIGELEAGCRACGVVIELGGNEMLGNGSAREYEHNLRKLIAESREHGAERVWLVELPPLPGRWSWPAAQRRVARDTGCIAIPRRVLASVLVDEANTFDGLHLTDRGHHRLARLMSVWLGLAAPAGNSGTS